MIYLLCSVVWLQEDGELDDSSGERHWSCDKPPVCGPGPLQLGLFNKHDGQIHWVPVYPPFLASLLPQVARNTSFCFIKCHSRYPRTQRLKPSLPPSSSHGTSWSGSEWHLGLVYTIKTIHGVRQLSSHSMVNVRGGNRTRSEIAWNSM